MSGKEDDQLDLLIREVRKLSRKVDKLSDRIIELESGPRTRRHFRGITLTEPVQGSRLPDQHQQALRLLQKVKGGPATATEVAQAIVVSRSRASEILNELFRLGLVEKRRFTTLSDTERKTLQKRLPPAEWGERRRLQYFLLTKKGKETAS